jgi:putative peptide zinc metalloprotease protein
MTATLFSREWYRIASLKPRLRDHLTVHAHRYRGKRWYLLEDHITGQVRKLTPQSYLIVGLMNGERSIDQLWDISSQRLGEEMPTHEEMLQLLSSLYQGNLIRMDIGGDVGELFERGHEARRKRWLAKLKSPLSIQIPLVDPDRFLEATIGLVRPLLTRFALFLWFLSIAAMLFMVGQHWEELTLNVADKVLAVDNIILLWLIYPVIKLLHELGHGYCVKRNGGEVHELGIMLLVLVPMPYVDASATSAFADKKQRVLVGMAGIIVELFAAAIAMFIWINAEPGLVKSIAFNTIIIAGVSTVLVNGNPLLRFDGYYVLGDFLEIPNLAQRSNQYWGWMTKRLLFGVKGHDSPAYDRREALWLFGYGIASFVYRMFLMATIVLFVAQQYFVIGVVLAIWALIGTLIWPNLKLLAKAFQDNDIRSGSRSPMWVIPMVAAMIVGLLAVLPVPLSTSIEGVVQLADERRVLAGENCFIDKFHQAAGASVHKGDLLVSCHNRRLRANQAILKQQYAEAEAQRQGVWDDPVQIKIYEQELARLDQEIKENRQQLDALNIYAEADGLWWVKNTVDQVGRYVTRGALVGHVITDEGTSVLGMIPEADIDLVRERVVDVRVLKASRLGDDLRPASWKIFPAASKELVSPILAEDAGGSVVVNPSESPPRALQRYFLVNLQFDALPLTRVEERILVKFEHPPEPLVYRGYRLVRRTFLEYFDV